MPQQSFGFTDQKLVVGEGIEADVLPADQAGAVDDKGGVERLVLEVVEAAIGLEGAERVVGEERDGKGAVLVVIDGLLQPRLVVAADGDERQAGSVELPLGLGESLQLLGTVQAAVTQEENHDDRLTLELG